MGRWRASAAESGQALVEAALVLPAMIFLILCGLQLMQIQQARVLLEYAAFSAARAGVVHNADNGRSHGASDGLMRQAAVLSLLSAIGPADSLVAMTESLVKFQFKDELVRSFGFGSLVQVVVLNPTDAAFTALGEHLNGREIDFDDVRPDATEATLLSLKVRCFFELRVPFANRMIQTLWLASRAGVLSLWRGVDLASPRLGSERGPDAVAWTRGVAAGRAAATSGLQPMELGALVAAGRAGHYFLPLEAVYTMRMQSNPFRRWAAP